MEASELKEKERYLEDITEDVHNKENIPYIIISLEKLGAHSFHNLSMRLKIDLLVESLGWGNVDEETNRNLLSYGGEVTRYLDLLDPGLSVTRGNVFCAINKALVSSY